MKNKVVPFLMTGLIAGLVSGLLGVGGGIAIVPLLVLAAGVSQHEAHATSLLAVVPIATVGALTYAADGAVELGAALFLIPGAVLGAPLGARMMARMSEARLKLVFGVLLVLLGTGMVVT